MHTYYGAEMIERKGKQKLKNAGQQAWIIVPTYNEAGNIVRLLEQVFALKSDSFATLTLHVLVVDDKSPDGTAQLVRTYQKKTKNNHLHLLVREGKRGRGLAGIAGFQYALKEGADFVLEMDADFSHDPCYVPALLAKCQEADVVLGSRFVADGKTVDRPWYRNLITTFANLYIRTVLGLHVRDCNSGFRCFKRKVLEAVDLDHFVSEGPAIVQELLYKAFLKGFRIAEVPIVFKEREEGNSKFGLKSLYKGYVMVLTLKIQKILGRI